MVPGFPLRLSVQPQQELLDLRPSSAGFLIIYLFIYLSIYPFNLLCSRRLRRSEHNKFFVNLLFNECAVTVGKLH